MCLARRSARVIARRRRRRIRSRPRASERCRPRAARRSRRRSRSAHRRSRRRRVPRSTPARPPTATKWSTHRRRRAPRAGPACVPAASARCRIERSRGAGRSARTVRAHSWSSAVRPAKQLTRWRRQLRDPSHSSLSRDGFRSCFRTQVDGPVELGGLRIEQRVVDRDEHHERAGRTGPDLARRGDAPPSGHDHVDQHQVGHALLDHTHSLLAPERALRPVQSRASWRSGPRGPGENAPGHRRSGSDFALSDRVIVV